MVTYDLVNHKMCQSYWIFSMLHSTYLQYEENDTDLHVRHSAMCKWNATHTRTCIYTSAYVKHEEAGTRCS